MRNIDNRNKNSLKMKTIKGPAIFLAQFIGEQPPFNNLENMSRVKFTSIVREINQIYFILKELGTILEKTPLCSQINF